MAHIQGIVYTFVNPSQMTCLLHCHNESSLASGNRLMSETSLSVLLHCLLCLGPGSPQPHLAHALFFENESYQAQKKVHWLSINNPAIAVITPLIAGARGFTRILAAVC